MVSLAWSTEVEVTLSERNRSCAICTPNNDKSYLSDYDRSYHKILMGSTSLAGIHFCIAPSVYAVAEELKKFAAERPALTKIHKREKALERLQEISSVLNKIAENYSALLVATSCQHDQCKNDGCKCPCHNGAEDIYPEDMLKLFKSLTPPYWGSVRPKEDNRQILI
jgi:hypothetical protein